MSLLQLKFGAANSAPLDLTITQAKGVRLFDTHSKSYLDLFASAGICVLGRSHPVFLERLSSRVGP